MNFLFICGLRVSIYLDHGSPMLNQDEVEIPLKLLLLGSTVSTVRQTLKDKNVFHANNSLNFHYISSIQIIFDS